MEPANIDAERFRTFFVLILVLAITALFAAVVWPFLQALLIGAILSGLCHPLYRWLVAVLRGRKSLASVMTLLLLFLVVAGPVSALLGLVVQQALTVSEQAIPWLQERFGAASSFDLHAWIVQRFPLRSDLVPSKEEIVKSVGTAAQASENILFPGRPPLPPEPPDSYSTFL